MSSTHFSFGAYHISVSRNDDNFVLSFRDHLDIFKASFDYNMVGIKRENLFAFFTPFFIAKREEEEDPESVIEFFVEIKQRGDCLFAAFKTTTRGVTYKELWLTLMSTLQLTPIDRLRMENLRLHERIEKLEKLILS